MKKFSKKLSSNVKKTMFVVVLLLLGILARDSFFEDKTTNSLELSEPVNFEEVHHLVERVIDGDTIIIEKEIEIRLIGIDAPEQGECYYQEAKDALTELVQDKYIIIEKDFKAKDNFGRLLRYVSIEEENPFLNNTFINKYLIEKGYAGLMPKTENVKYWNILESTRNEARRQNIGIWSVCERKQESTNAHPQEADDNPTDPDCVIKGNISKDGYGKTYFTVGCANYNRTKIDFSKGEAYFCTEQEAEAAGFIKAASCK